MSRTQTTLRVKRFLGRHPEEPLQFRWPNPLIHQHETKAGGHPGDEPSKVELRQLIQTARLGARPDEVIEAPEMDPRRRDVAASYINWLNEWREVARVAVSRRDYRISLGIAQRRQSSEEPDEPVVGPSPAPIQA